MCISNFIWLVQLLIHEGCKVPGLHCDWVKISICLLISINFKQYEPPQKEVPEGSEVLKALLEQESQMKGVAGLPEFQEDTRQSNLFSFD